MSMTNKVVKSMIESQNITSFEMIDDLNLDVNVKLSLYKQLMLDFFRRSESIKHKAQVDYSPTNLQELKEWSIEFSKSELCPKHLKGKPIDVLMTAQLGSELNLKPVQAIRTIFIVNGIASTYGDGTIALIRGSGLCEYIKEWTEGKIEDETFIAYCEMKRKGEPAIVKSFSYKQAKKAKLINKLGTWQDYPDQMIQRRATGKSAKSAFADVLWGLVSEEEGQDILDHENQRAKAAVDITPLKKGNEGVRQLLDIVDDLDSMAHILDIKDDATSKNKESSNESEKVSEEEPLATEQEVEQLISLIEAQGLMTQQQQWLKQAKAERLEELKQKTVQALIRKYSSKED